MLKIRIVLFFIFIILISVNFVSAQVTIAPQKVKLGEEIAITIDYKTGYGTNVYFYDSSGKEISVIDLNCGENGCFEEEKFTYTLSSSLFTLGTYKVAVYSIKDKFWKFSEFEVVSEADLEPETGDETPIQPPSIPISSNTKAMSLYQNKEVFLISDENWKNVLPLVPVTTWTQGSEIKKYPTLIYHAEDNSPLYIDLEDYSGEHGIMGFASFVGGSGQFSSQKSISQAYNLQPGQIITYSFSIKPVSGEVKKIWIFIPDFLEFVNPFDGIYDNIYLSLPYFTTFTFTLKVKGDSNTVFSEAFDADSIIHFMQQYSPSKATIVGETSIELDNLIASYPEDVVGAGLRTENIQRINSNDYLNYWQAFDTLVYVEDNYELALLASTYASLLNAPLIIKGTGSDIETIFSGRNIICVGNVAPAGSSCKENYNLEQLINKYETATNTNKFLLVNSNDQAMAVKEINVPDKSTAPLFNLYTKTSLIAPILASAKHELLLSTTSTNYQTIDSFIQPKLSQGDYLTIMAAPNAIPYREYSHQIGFFTTDPAYRALDQTQYSDINEDLYPEIYTGRIMGISSSDVSGYVARDLFYDTFQKTNNMKFVASAIHDFTRDDLYRVNNWASIFRDVGYNALSITSEEVCYNFDASEWENQNLVLYIDHGGENWAGFGSTSEPAEIPLLKNSIIINDACLTCSTYDSKSFCNNAIRQGAIAHLGAVSIASDKNEIYMEFMNGVYYSDLSFGEAFVQAYSIYKNYDSTIYKNYYMTTLFGDPTIKINPSHLLNKELPYRSLGSCTEVCTIWYYIWCDYSNYPTSKDCYCNCPNGCVKEQIKDNGETCGGVA